MNNPPSSILVGTDLSDCSGSAVETAVWYAKTFPETKITVVTVFDPTPFVAPVAIAGPTEMFDSAADEMKKTLESALVEVKKQFGADADRVETMVLRHHSPGDAVAELASERDADLVIVGSHGRTGLSRVLLGSVAERIVRLSHGPVLVVRPTDDKRESKPR